MIWTTTSWLYDRRWILDVLPRQLPKSGVLFRNSYVFFIGNVGATSKTHDIVGEMENDDMT